MFQQDYLMRMIVQFARGLRLSMERGQLDPADAAESVEEAIAQALDLDVSVVLGLHPESFASILAVSGTDPHLVEYLVQGLMLQAHYLDQAGDASIANLRRDQAIALAKAFDHEPPSPDDILTEEDLDYMEQAASEL